MTDGPDDDVKDVPEPEQQEEPAKPAYDPEVAEEARLWGWKPADEWVGDRKEGFIEDPSRYLDRLKSSRLFKTFEERLSEKERDLDERARRLDSVYQKTLERQRNEFKANLDRITAGQRKAVEVADVAAYEQLEREKRSLVPPPSDELPPRTQQPEEPPELVRARERFISEREWAKDPALRFEGATAIDVAMRSGRHFASYEDQLQYADGVMRKRYPHLFQQSAPAQTRQRVDGGGLAGASSGSSTGFEKLPAEAKQAFKRFVAQGVFQDTAEGRKQYVEDYNA